MPPDPTAQSPKRDNNTPSCAVCNRRKVKCDRVYPCAPCRKTGLECSFPEPARKRARRKAPTPESEERPKRNCASSANHPCEEQRQSGGTRYGIVTDGSSIIESQKDASPSFRRSLSINHGFNLVFSLQSHLEPLPISLTQALTIGEAYRRHVDPVVKVFHCKDPWICGNHGNEWYGEDLDLTKAPDRCLLRAVLFVTAVATDGSDLLGLQQFQGRMLIERCRVDAEATLSEANFMRTRELRVLQALVLYMIALQSLGEDDTVWAILGMAIRIASSLGLPQDLGEGAIRDGPLTPYQIELRRRLWWAIVALDARITRILGRTGYLSHNFPEIPRPANADDSQLHPAMTDIPNDQKSLRESVYIRYRATLSDVLPFIYASRNANDKATGLIDMVETAERQIEEEFVQHCDKWEPIKLLTFIAGRGYVKRIKLAMYSISPVTEDPLSQTLYASEAFYLAKDSMDLFITLWADPTLKPWHWHWKDFFGWHTLRILVQEISKRAPSSAVVDAWKLVKRTASLAVSALKLGEEKARLVGDLRMLLEAGDIRPDVPPEAYSYALGAIKSIRPGMGSNPHNALFPAMNSTISDGHEELGNGGVAEFDLARINWTEIDRVLARLGKYHSV